MKILITGYKGFIGQNLMSLLEKEHQVAGYEWDEENLPYIKGFDWVIHLGAISSTTERDIDKIILRNYEFSKWLYNQCQIYGVNLQYASSASIYGSTTHFTEDGPPDPQSPYAWSKYLFDRWVTGQQSKVIVQGYRYFNVYGPNEHHKKDQASPVHKFTEQAKNNGIIYLFENSEIYQRDFVFVGDICQVHRDMLNIQESGVFNVGTGTATSFKDIAEVIAEKYSAKIEYIPMPEILQNQYQRYTCANINKLSQHININWTKVSDYINTSF